MIGNQTILHTARQLEWSSSPSYKQLIANVEPCPTKALKKVLITELTNEQWFILTTSTSEAIVQGNGARCE